MNNCTESRSWRPLKLISPPPLENAYDFLSGTRYEHGNPTMIYDREKLDNPLNEHLFRVAFSKHIIGKTYNTGFQITGVSLNDKQLKVNFPYYLGCSIPRIIISALQQVAMVHQGLLQYAKQEASSNRVKLSNRRHELSEKHIEEYKQCREIREKNWEAYAPQHEAYKAQVEECKIQSEAYKEQFEAYKEQYEAHKKQQDECIPKKQILKEAAQKRNEAIRQQNEARRKRNEAIRNQAEASKKQTEALQKRYEIGQPLLNESTAPPSLKEKSWKEKFPFNLFKSSEARAFDQDRISPLQVSQPLSTFADPSSSLPPPVDITIPPPVVFPELPKIFEAESPKPPEIPLHPEMPPRPEMPFPDYAQHIIDEAALDLPEPQPQYYIRQLPPHIRIFRESHERPGVIIIRANTEHGQVSISADQVDILNKFPMGFSRLLELEMNQRKTKTEENIELIAKYLSEMGVYFKKPSPAARKEAPESPSLDALNDADRELLHMFEFMGIPWSVTN